MLTLIVIRTGDMPKLVEFYTQLSLQFNYHKHGSSPFHYSAKTDGTTIEIYPLAKDQLAADRNLRLGFTIENFEEVTALLTGGSIISGPPQTEWGYIAIAEDPDGRKVELYRKDK